MTDEQITTVEELEALPLDTVVREQGGILMTRMIGPYWSGEGREWGMGQVRLPATVLFRPDRPAGVKHGPTQRLRNGDGPWRESKKCVCGLPWPHPGDPTNSGSNVTNFRAEHPDDAAELTNFRPVGPSVGGSPRPEPLVTAKMRRPDFASPVGVSEDDEEFCSRCFAGVDSDEHHGKCVVTGYAEDGESAPAFDARGLLLGGYEPGNALGILRGRPVGPGGVAIVHTGDLDDYAAAWSEGFDEAMRQSVGDEGRLEWAHRKATMVIADWLESGEPRDPYTASFLGGCIANAILSEAEFAPSLTATPEPAKCGPSIREAIETLDAVSDRMDELAYDEIHSAIESIPDCELALACDHPHDVTPEQVEAGKALAYRLEQARDNMESDHEVVLEMTSALHDYREVFLAALGVTVTKKEE